MRNHPEPLLKTPFQDDPMNQTQNQVVKPTTKYTAYVQEVQTSLKGSLRLRERRRLEQELILLRRARFITLRGITHHYQDEGPRHGHPIILVHGWDCSSFWWHHVVGPLVAAGYRVISYDLKGHGFSDTDPKNNYSVQSFSEELRELAEKLNLQPQHIFAFSLGAGIALNYATKWHEQVQSLAFFNFGLFPTNPLFTKTVPLVLGFVFNKILRPLVRRDLWMAPFIYARLFLAKNTPRISDIKLGVLGVKCCDPDAVLLSAQELAKREILHDIPRQMSTIKQPILMVAGEGDPVVRPESGRRLMALAYDGTFIQVPRCGHTILFELPELVVQILHQHLRAAECTKEQ